MMLRSASSIVWQQSSRKTPSHSLSCFRITTKTRLCFENPFNISTATLRQRDTCTSVCAVEARLGPHPQDKAGASLAATGHLFEDVMATCHPPGMLWFKLTLENSVGLLRQRNTHALCLHRKPERVRRLRTKPGVSWRLATKDMVSSSSTCSTVFGATCSRCDHLWAWRAQATLVHLRDADARTHHGERDDSEVPQCDLVNFPPKPESTIMLRLRTPVVGHGVFVEITHLPAVNVVKQVSGDLRSIREQPHRRQFPVHHRVSYY